MKFISPQIASKVFFDGSERKRAYKKLSAMIENGLGITQSLSHLLRRAKKNKSPLTIVYSEVVRKLNRGSSLAAALDGLIPAEERMLIGSGLSSGNVSEALELCVKLINAKSKIISSLLQALSYPILLFCGLGSLLLLVVRFVVPKLEKLSPPETWEGSAYALYQVASFLDSLVGYAIVSLFLLAIPAIIVSFPYLTSRIRLVLDRVPPWSFYRLIHGSLWLFTLSTLLKAGVQLGVAMDDMKSGYSKNPWLLQRVTSVSERIALGRGLGEALDETGFNFPDKELVDDLLVYSTLPRFHKQLHQIAEQWLNEGLSIISTQAKILNVFCMAAVIALLCSIGLAVSSLQQSLGHGMAGF